MLEDNCGFQTNFTAAILHYGKSASGSAIKRYQACIAITMHVQRYSVVKLQIASIWTRGMHDNNELSPL